MRENNFIEEDIEDTLLQLSKTKPFDKITVTDIVKKCGISRQTFYYHYEDILQLADKALSRKFKEAADKAEVCKSIKEALSVFVGIMEENRSIILYMRNSKSKEHLISEMLINIKRALMKMPVNSVNGDKKLDLYSIEQYDEFFTHGILGFLLVNLIEKNSSPEKISEQLYWILDKNFNAFLN